MIYLSRFTSLGDSEDVEFRINWPAKPQQSDEFLWSSGSAENIVSHEEPLRKGSDFYGEDPLSHRLSHTFSHQSCPGSDAFGPLGPVGFPAPASDSLRTRFCLSTPSSIASSTMDEPTTFVTPPSSHVSFTEPMITNSAPQITIPNQQLTSPITSHTHSHIAPLTEENLRRLQQPKCDTRLYKTEMCLQFMQKGVCSYGYKCQFAHGEAELIRVDRGEKYKSKPCANWARTGSCRYGRRCRFKHGDE